MKLTINHTRRSRSSTPSQEAKWRRARASRQISRPIVHGPRFEFKFAIYSNSHSSYSADCSLKSIPFPYNIRISIQINSSPNFKILAARKLAQTGDGKDGKLRKNKTVKQSYLGSNLVTALTGLNVNDFPHFLELISSKSQNKTSRTS